MNELHPILKWAGGKTQILEKIIELAPKEFNRYFEPFVGGGAVLFKLQPASFVINDRNGELISLYRTLCDESAFQMMLSLVDEYQKNHSKENYYNIRSLDRNANFSEYEDYRKGARMLYLNKTCFNGLFRVNSKGFFNVPWNGNEHPKCYDATNITNVHNFMKQRNHIILNEDFEEAVKSAKKGDFVYFDPPYDTFENQNNFTTYTKDNFDKNDQIRLANLVHSLSDKGVYVMVSNHNTEFIRSLYKDFKITVVCAKRLISAKNETRGFVEEVIITTY